MEKELSKILANPVPGITISFQDFEGKDITELYVKVFGIESFEQLIDKSEEFLKKEIFFGSQYLEREKVST